MTIISRTSLEGCVLLRGNFGAPLVSNLRGHWRTHLRILEARRAAKAGASPEYDAQLDCCISKLRAYVAGRGDISPAELRRELEALRARW